jgi:hypothetical protein
VLGAGSSAGLIAALGSAAPALAGRSRPINILPPVLLDTYIEPRLLARARAAFDTFRGRLEHRDLVGIVDFSLPSREPRFHILDTVSGRVSKHLVSHGRGSDPGHTGWLGHFSNEIGSEASSAGAYLTGDLYHGKYGRSMKVHGLERRNSNADARAIVIHSAWYAEPHVAEAHGKLGRSEGCFAFSQASLREVMERLGPGRLLYADKV